MEDLWNLVYLFWIRWDMKTASDPRIKQPKEAVLEGWIFLNGITHSHAALSSPLTIWKLAIFSCSRCRFSSCCGIWVAAGHAASLHHLEQVWNLVPASDWAPELNQIGVSRIQSLSSSSELFSSMWRILHPSPQMCEIMVSMIQLFIFRS